MDKKMDDVKSKAKDFMKKLGTFGHSPRAFKGQGHRLGSDPLSLSAPSSSPKTTSDGAGGVGGVSGRPIGTGGRVGDGRQREQQVDWRKLQQEKWERERGVTPAAQLRETLPTPQLHEAPRFSRNHAESMRNSALQVSNLKLETHTDAVATAHEVQHRVEMIGQSSPASGSERVSTANFDPFVPFISSHGSQRSGAGRVEEKPIAKPHKVQCPVCQKWWQSEQEVSAHIDDCTGTADGASEVGDQDKLGNGSHGSEAGVSSNRDLEDAVGFFISGGPSTATTDVILRLLRNILVDPSAEKFRKVRLGNPKIKETIGAAVGGFRLLECVGFQRTVEGDDSLLVMKKSPTKEQTRQLQDIIYFLDFNLSTKAAPAANDIQLSQSTARPHAKLDRQVRS